MADSDVDKDEMIITLHNEELDVDEDFYNRATLFVDCKRFAVVEPVNATPVMKDTADFTFSEVLILEVQEGDDRYFFLPVEDEELLQKVLHRYATRKKVSCDKKKEDR